MIADIDLQLGRRLRRRRQILGLTQQQIAARVGIRFQQVQKYECAANKMSAERLWGLAKALEVPVTYFYDGLADDASADAIAATAANEADDIIASKETRELVTAYYRLDRKPRRHLLELARALDVRAAS